jgi:hypothetical protein
MPVYQPKGQKKWVYNFYFDGQRVRVNTGVSNKTLAKKMEADHRRDLEEGKAGVKKSKKPALLFRVAVEKYLERRTTQPKPWQPKTLAMAQNSQAHLLPVFGQLLLRDIEPDHVREYQKQRTAEGAAPTTINIEVGLLRSVMGSLWTRMQEEQEDKDDKVTFFEEPDTGGRKLEPEEEARWLRGMMRPVPAAVAMGCVGSVSYAAGGCRSASGQGGQDRGLVAVHHGAHGCPLRPLQSGGSARRGRNHHRPGGRFPRVPAKSTAIRCRNGKRSR